MTREMQAGCQVPGDVMHLDPAQHLGEVLGGSPPRAGSAGGDELCKTSSQSDDSAPGSLRNVVTASSRAGARFLLPHNS